jgi:hypothetical protein
MEVVYKQAYRAGQAEMRERAAEASRLDCQACGGSRHASHPLDPDPVECEYCGRPCRRIASLPLEGDDE